MNKNDQPAGVTKSGARHIGRVAACEAVWQCLWEMANDPGQSHPPRTSMTIAVEKTVESYNDGSLVPDWVRDLGADTINQRKLREWYRKWQRGESLGDKYRGRVGPVLLDQPGLRERVCELIDQNEHWSAAELRDALVAQSVSAGWEVPSERTLGRFLQDIGVTGAPRPRPHRGGWHGRSGLFERHPELAGILLAQKARHPDASADVIRDIIRPEIERRAVPLPSASVIRAFFRTSETSRTGL